MSFASIAIKTSIPVTAPAATSGALTFFTIEDENWLQITGDASAGSGSLYVLRWNADLSEWRPYMEDKPIAVNSATLNGLFSAYYPFPKGEESFVLYDPASAITATASAARTGSPLVAPTPASSGASGGATEAKQDTGNSSLVSILGQLDSKTSTLATASAQTTGNNSLSNIDSKVATAAKQDIGNTSLATIATQQTDGSQKATVTQGAGSGSAATFWYTRNTDGTNTQPTMDTAARSGFQRITDGTNTAAVKAASTAAATTDPAVVVATRPQGSSFFNCAGVNETRTLKSGAGVLRRVIVNPGSGGSTCTIYDNTAGSGTVIHSFTTSSSGALPFTLTYDAAFSTGLTYTTASGTQGNLTFIWD